MADLEFTGDLDISPALQSVDELSTTIESSLGAAVDNFAALFESALGGLGDQLASALGDVTAEVPVTADTSAAEQSAQSLASEIDGETGTITVDADTSGADEQLQSLADQVDSTSASASQGGRAFGDLGARTEALAGIAGVAVGEVGGLKDATGLLGESALPAVAGIGALTGGVAELIKSGIEAVSATQRFDVVLGDMGDAVQKVQVGDLNTKLFDLTKLMGSTRSATEQAAATIFTFASNAGASKQQATQFTDELFALASRAVALKPSLGDVSDVAARMEVGLGRARSAAQQFGISISQTEINTRALSDTGKTSTGLLTAYEKSLAGAEIAIERYGNSLQGTIAKGSQNAAIEQARLTAEVKTFIEETGRPLVAPAFDALKAGIPVAKELAQTLGGLAQTVLPVVAETLRLIGPAIPPVVTGFLAFEAVTRIIGPALALAAGGIEATAGALPIMGAAAETAAGEVAGASAAITELEATSGIGLLIVGLGAAAAAFGLFGSSSGDATQAAKDFADQLSKTADDALLAAFYNSITKTIGAVGDFKGSLNESRLGLAQFGSVADNNVGTAQRLLDAMKGAGINTDAYQKILDKAVASQKAQNAAQQESSSTTSQLTADQRTLGEAAQTSLAQFATGTGTATQALKDLKTAQQEENDALTLYQTLLEEQLGLQGDVTAATIALANAVQSTADAFKKNGSNVDLNSQAGRDNVQTLLGQVKAAESVAEATYKTTAATQGVQAATDAANGVMQNFTFSLEGQLKQFGLNDLQIADVLQKLGLLTNGHWNFKVTADDQASGTLDHIKGIADSIPRDIAIQVRAAAAAGADLSLLGGVPHVIGNNLDGSPIYGYASGGDFAAGKPFIAGENGPEIIVPASAGTVLPNAVYRASSADSGGGASNRAGQGGATFQIDRVVMEQATPNPVRETIRAAKQLRDAAAMARMT